MFITVITSYSIHYTKLYDGGFQDRVVRDGEGIIEEPKLMRTGRKRLSMLTTTGSGPRITSYNVCYTKLLRKRLPGGHSE